VSAAADAQATARAQLRSSPTSCGRWWRATVPAPRRGQIV
jgi:hypothetical protein